MATRFLLQANLTEPLPSPPAPGPVTALDLIQQSPWWVYVLIPLVAAAVGWLTNVLALKMTFYPLEFFGWKLWQPELSPLGLFGWQGIIPCKAGKMAGICARLMTEKLINITEVFNRIEPDVLASIMMPAIEKSTARAVQTVARAEFPDVWEALPQEVKEEIFDVANQDAEMFITDLLDGLRADVLEYFDLQALVVRRSIEYKHLVVQMFQRVGAKEFKFIEHSGAYFGFMFGLVQMIIYLFYKANWVLPVAGFFVGYATNYLALYVIFKPILPKKVCCFTFQGLFMTRQEEVAQEMAYTSREYYLKGEYMWEEILTGSKCEKFYGLLDEVTERFIDQKSGAVGRLAATVVLGPGGYDRVKKQVAKVIREELPESVKLGHKYTEEVLNVEPEMRERLAALPPDQFERVLHPAFEEDELLLVLVGAVLGLIVGGLQVVLYPSNI